MPEELKFGIKKNFSAVSDSSGSGAFSARSLYNQALNEIDWRANGLVWRQGDGRDDLQRPLQSKDPKSWRTLGEGEI